MVLQVIRDRSSVRNFSDKEVSNEVILDILEAARLAPSWVNVQPWHFIVVRDRETRELLSQLSHGQAHVAQAPVIIVCCGDTEAWETEKYKEILELRPGITEERVNAFLNSPVLNPKVKGEEAVICRTVEEVTYAVAYMTLEAHNKGVGACIVGAVGNELTESIPEVYQQVRKKLGLKDNIMLISLLLLGYPAADFQKPNKVRRVPDEIISFERYGNKKI